MAGNGNGGTTGDSSMLAELAEFADELKLVYRHPEHRSEIEPFYTKFPHGSLESARLEGPRNGALLQDLLGELLPLSRVLSGLGYHDVALRSAELAEEYSPGISVDARLARAYLLTLLGDTEEAEDLYLEAHTELGRIPATDLAMLEDVVREHPEEEDIAELLTRLRAL